MCKDHQCLARTCLQLMLFRHFRHSYTPEECEALLELLASIRGVRGMLQAAQGWLQTQAAEHLYCQLMRFVEESIPGMLAHDLHPEVMSQAADEVFKKPVVCNPCSKY